MKAGLDFFRSQINRIPGAKNITSTRAYVLCPFHKERTPSGVITIDPSKRRWWGSFKCYGCNKTAEWNEVAEKYNLLTLAGGRANIKDVPAIDTQQIRASLMPETEKEERRLKMDFFPLQDDWRGFKKAFLEEVGAKLVYHDLSGKFYVWFPVVVKGKEVGFFRAQMEKPTSKKVPSYLNKPGPWTKTRGLFPFDYALEVMKAGKWKTLVLVEGPRDALRLLARGIPAVAIMGTQNWSTRKLMLLLNTNIKQVIFLFDGDKAGRQATLDIWPQVKKHLQCKVVQLWKVAEKLGLEKVDPCDMPNKYVRLVRKHLI